WSARFKHAAGPLLSLRLYREEGEGGYVYRSNGVECRTSGFSLTRSEGSDSAPHLPSRAEPDAGDPSCIPIPAGLAPGGIVHRTVVDPDRVIVALQRGLLSALIEDDQSTIATLGKALKRHGEPDFELACAIDGKYIPRDFADKMEKAR